MSERREPPDGPPALSDWEVERLAAHLDELLERLIGRGDHEIAASVVGLLEGIERLHADGVRRIAELVARDGTMFARARRDPVIAALFDLYEVSVADGAEQGHAATALDPGGEGPPFADTSIVPTERLVKLRRRLDRAGGAAADEAPGEREPRVGTVELSELDRGDLLGVSVGKVSVVLVRAGADVRAFRNACPGSPLPLHLGSVEDGALRCPWHGCRFDIESGTRLDEEGASLRPLATRIEDGLVRIELS